MSWSPELICGVAFLVCAIWAAYTENRKWRKNSEILLKIVGRIEAIEEDLKTDEFYDEWGDDDEEEEHKEDS